MLQTRIPLVVFVLAIASSCAFQPATEADLAEAEAVSSSRPMLISDPNRNPSWDWTQDQTYTLQTTNQTYSNVHLPYFSNAGPASVLNVANNRDISPLDGWVLVLRDFGPGANVPFYVLYNRYRGVLRVFYYYYPVTSTLTRAVGKIRFQTQTQPLSAALFTLGDAGDTAGSYVNSYDPTRETVSIGALGIGWCFLDFNVAGFDPALIDREDPTLMIEVAGVTETNIALSGSLDLEQQVASAHREGGTSGFNRVVNGVITAFNGASKIYSDVVKAATGLATNSADPTSHLHFAHNFLQSIVSTLAPFSFVGQLGSVASVLRSIVGGGSRSASQPTPMIFDGDLQINGSLTSNAPLYTFIMRTPGSRHVDAANDAMSNLLPLYDTPLGVFNLAAAPTHRMNHTHTHPSATSPQTWDASTWSVMQAPIVPEVNLKVFDVVSISASYGLDGVFASAFSPHDYVNSNIIQENFTYSLPATSYPYSPTQWQNMVANHDVIVQAVLRPKGAAPGLNDVTVIRAYRAPSTLVPNATTVPTDDTIVPRPSSLTRTSTTTLQWIDNDREETQVVVQRRTGSGVWVTIANLPPNTASYLDQTLAQVPSQTTTYQYRVLTREGTVSSPASNTVTVTLQGAVRSE